MINGLIMFLKSKVMRWYKEEIKIVKAYIKANPDVGASTLAPVIAKHLCRTAAAIELYIYKNPEKVGYKRVVKEYRKRETQPSSVNFVYIYIE